MPDQHKPPLSSLVFSKEENRAIEIALKTEHPWDHSKAATREEKTILESVKKKLSDLHMQRQNHQCCYCKSVLKERGPFVRDREHILPKERFKRLTYAPFNISISCKRCNMEIKGKEFDFIVDPMTILDDAENADRYKIVHPNFEVWEEHLEIFSIQHNAKYLTTYNRKKGDAKGEYTYEYFKLSKISVSSFDTAQGDEKVANEIQNTIDMLASIHDQV